MTCSPDVGKAVHLVYCFVVIGMMSEVRLELQHAVGHVTRLILQTASKDLLVNVGLGDHLARAKDRQHEPFSQQVEQKGPHRVRGRFQNCGERPFESGCRMQQAAAGDGAFAKDFLMSRLVYELSR